MSSLQLRLLLIGLAATQVSYADSKDSLSLESLMPSIVLITTADYESQHVKVQSFGTGTIIDSKGSILTNHHLLRNPESDEYYDRFYVSLYRGSDRPLETLCYGTPSHGTLRPELDMAKIRCEYELDESPLEYRSWPAIETSAIDVQDIEPGTQVWVIGYPRRTHRPTLSFSTGLISGWTSGGHLSDGTSMIKTDAMITHGNSGGIAVDEWGRLIGVPSAYRHAKGSRGPYKLRATVGLIRPIFPFRDWIRPGATQLDLRRKIVDRESGNAIANATFTLENKAWPRGRERVVPIVRAYSDAFGDVWARVPTGSLTSSEMVIVVRAPGYEEFRQDFNARVEFTSAGLKPTLVMEKSIFNKF